MNVSAVEVRPHAPLLLDPVLRRLQAHHPLDAADQRALSAGSTLRTRHPIGATVAREGEAASEPQFIVRGWVAAFRALPDGRRQIFRLLLPGDTLGLDLAVAPLRWSVITLTPVDTIAATEAVQAAVSGRAPGLARAFALAVREEERLILDQLVRLGRMTAYERMAHLLLELRDRLAVAGLGDARRFPIPLTQDALADTLGLSAVHVNRVLKALRDGGLVSVTRGMATLLQPAELAAIAGREPTTPGS